MSKHILFLGLGSNLGDKKQNINIAYEEIIKRIGVIKSRSAFYHSEPQGFVSDNEFHNTVCEVETDLSVHVILQELIEIEKLVGRISKSVNGIYSDRLIDIDILMYDDLVIGTDILEVPHPRFHMRDFVLVPFAEISSHTIHPKFNKTIGELLRELA